MIAIAILFVGFCIIGVGNELSRIFNELKEMNRTKKR